VLQQPLLVHLEVIFYNHRRGQNLSNKIIILISIGAHNYKRIIVIMETKVLILMIFELMLMLLILIPNIIFETVTLLFILETKLK
jgi:hypothetical protein